MHLQDGHAAEGTSPERRALSYEDYVTGGHAGGHAILQPPKPVVASKALLPTTAEDWFGKSRNALLRLLKPMTGAELQAVATLVGAKALLGNPLITSDKSTLREALTEYILDPHKQAAAEAGSPPSDWSEQSPEAVYAQLEDGEVSPLPSTNLAGNFAFRVGFSSNEGSARESLPIASAPSGAAAGAAATSGAGAISRSPVAFIGDEVGRNGDKSDSGGEGAAVPSMAPRRSRTYYQILMRRSSGSERSSTESASGVGRQRGPIRRSSSYSFSLTRRLRSQSRKRSASAERAGSVSSWS